MQGAMGTVGDVPAMVVVPALPSLLPIVGLPAG